MDFGTGGLYIDGRIREAQQGRVETIRCPATEQPIAQLAWAAGPDVEDALRAAREGFQSWSGLTPEERAGWIGRLRERIIEREDHLRRCVMYETGKPWEGTAEDFAMLVDALRFYPEAMRRMGGEVLPDPQGAFHHTLLWEPVGVVAAVIAWNFPLLNLAFKVGPALAAGCSMVVKPSPRAPLSAYAVGELMAEMDFPAGVVNVLCGEDDVVGPALTASPVPAMVTVIGSSETGRRVMRQGSSTVKRYSMELGGNAPVLVFEDADLSRAAETVSALKFGNAGQICVAPNRVFVHGGVGAEFCERMVQKAHEQVVGFGRDSGATVGPLISAEARERVHSLVGEALEQGAELLCGGAPPERPAEGYFYLPTVLRGVRPEMRIFKEEIFGPVVSIIEFEAEKEALRRANDTWAGLASYVFTRDLERALRVAGALRFGEVQVNGAKYSIELPHCGIGQSGMGCDCSHLALHDYLNPKRLTVARR